MAQEVKYDGVPFRLAGRWYVVPALGLKQLRRHKELLTEFLQIEQKQRENPEPADVFTVLELSQQVVSLALRRNYPNLSDEEIEDFVDMNNATALVTSIMGQSGLQRVTEEPSGGAVGPEGK